MDKKDIALKDLQTAQIESFITPVSPRLGRQSLQGDISALRGFLRFLALDGRVPPDLAGQIDRPRVHGFEPLRARFRGRRSTLFYDPWKEPQRGDCGTTRCFC